MIKVLFVCLGNICRSPLAEGVFKKMTSEAGLSDKILCDSAGTAGYHTGELPDRRTIKIARQHGIELDHLARKLKPQDLTEFDYILAMDKSNMEDILKLKSKTTETRAEIFLFRFFDDDQQNGDVPDPYYGNMEDFELVYKISLRCSEAFLRYLKERHHLQHYGYRTFDKS
ncbi:MAG: low molecular weight phosphotyrosine protein phosphatase [Cytophagaceae bacterium]|nr:low molecular weight phosphotyrosine protein phosphatase [Cytophagaceae bacterium]MDW8457421.1 low molecular weight protein-tyrosine-phosphatase [Cytophagaceae bacterium]